MYYAKQTDDGFHITVLKVLFPDTSFPDTGPDAAWLADYGVYPVEEHLYFDANEFKRNSIEPVLMEDGVVYVAELAALTDDDKKQREVDRLAQLASVAREQRNRLLAECDWTQLEDSSVDKAAWAGYRSQLRQITTQQSFPSVITWPAHP